MGGLGVVTDVKSRPFENGIVRRSSVAEVATCELLNGSSNGSLDYY